jgi:hypothetical protein
MENEKAKCLTCMYRGPVPHSRHSSCHHPRVDDIMGDHDTLAKLIDLLAGGITPNFFDDLRIEITEGAIESRWALWPFNFDPVWIESCTGYMDAR